ncbi:BED zinc finger, hAT family dimerization domain protein [Artemisia annua]|uniref:BED zinc finger, hAT family dimerization domain protein n=1 Tax=Artemisia annua TaxID=35608 RepID=A0A2U1KCN6_ARTAN|nr:BED zinc finger, hAT family dimerization domain protein [Artemisia annua]
MASDLHRGLKRRRGKNQLCLQTTRRETVGEICKKNRHIGFCDKPKYNMGDLNTVQGDCVAAYLSERSTVENLIAQMLGRICFTLDLWNSNNTTGYIYIMGQFTDSDWNIHKRLLKVVMEPYPESDSAFTNVVSACLSVGNIKGRLFSVTLNQNQPLSEIGINGLRSLLSRNIWKANWCFAGKFGAVFASIPAPIIAALYRLFFAYLRKINVLLYLCRIGWFELPAILQLQQFQDKIHFRIFVLSQPVCEYEGYGPVHTSARWVLKYNWGFGNTPDNKQQFRMTTIQDCTTKKINASL